MLTLLTLLPPRLERLTAKLRLSSLVKLSVAAAPEKRAFTFPHEKRVTPAHTLGGGAAPRRMRLGAGMKDGGEVGFRGAVGERRASAVSVKQVMDNLPMIERELVAYYKTQREHSFECLRPTIALDL
jgi:hypothetical protein